MIVPLSSREMELIAAWREVPLWPDEERILGKLRHALGVGVSPRLSRLQVEIVLGWLEEQIGGHYGRRVLNPDEQAIMVKLKAAREGTQADQ